MEEHEWRIPPPYLSFSVSTTPGNCAGRNIIAMCSNLCLRHVPVGSLGRRRTAKTLVRIANGLNR